MNDLTEAQPKALWFKAVLFAGMLLFAFYASTHMVAAGDTWVAMACGRHFDNHGVDTIEPFSFNSHPAGPSDKTLEKFPEWTHGMIRKWHPTGWLNQNWLTHLGFYKLSTWFGDGNSFNFNTLVYWKFALYFLTVFCVYGIGKTLGLDDTLAAVSACVAMIVGRTFYDIRPAGYSNMLVPALVLIMALAICKNYRWIWLIIPLIVFWSNVHGGYIYAFIMLVPFIGVNLLLKLPKRWAIGLGLCGLWLLLYLMSHKFITGYKSMIDQFYAQVQANQPLTQGQTNQLIARATQQVFGYNPDNVSLIFNNLFWTWLVLAVIALVLTSIRKIKTGVFYFFMFFIGGVYIISLAPRFIVGSSKHLPEFFGDMGSSSLLSFSFVAVVASLMIIALAFKKEAFQSLSVRGLCHTVGAAAAALLAMIVFNPFHLTNITHTFEISISKHAESWRQVNEWKPAFDFMDKMSNVPNPVGKEGAFGVMLALTAVIFTVWLVTYFLSTGPKVAGPSRKRRHQAETPVAAYRPQINIAIIVLAFLTIYMAIRSRRFITLAGALAPPVLAIFLVQIWQMVTARFKSQNSETDNPLAIVLPPSYRSIIRGVITLTLAFLAVFWGLKYKRIYLDPWPSDHQYNSVFMRMTASHLKPADACTFIRDNNISGRVFNYWTEGGAVAFGQTPDPETGHVPLKLFMDGRAQAAYNHDKFKLWQQLFAGGPNGIKAAKVKIQLDKLTKNRQTRSDSYKKQLKAYGEALDNCGQWINGQLDERDVWVVLMPQSQELSTFVKSLKKAGNWKTAYIDDYQHLLVNNKTPRGKALIQKILEGQASFPSDYSKNMTTYMAIIENQAQDQYKELYTLVSDAFKEFPTPAAAVAMINLRRFSAYKQNVLTDGRAYIDDFAKNRETYRKQDGYHQRLACAGIIADKLFKEQYAALLEEIDAESKSIKKRTVW